MSAAKKLMDLFRGSETASGTHGVPEKDIDGLKWNIKNSAKTLRVPVTEELWEKHLKGERPLGVIPIREDNTCQWGSIDFDVYDVDLLEVVKQVEQAKFPLVPCVSKSGGLHLFLFLEAPEPAADVQNVLREAAASLGMAESEIFPKQQRILAERKDLGNWMVMPYFGQTYNGKLRMQRGLKKTGAEMTVDEFVKVAEKARTRVEEFFKLTSGRRGTMGNGKQDAKSKKKPRMNGGASHCDFSDGPPCLQYLATSGVQSDGRKRTLFHMALYFKRADPDGWKTRIEEANRKFFKTALPSSEVTGIINSLEKKDYEYTCKEEPMKSHCNSMLCKTRRFGVGQGGFPVIGGLSKIEGEEPVWFVDVEDKRIELTTDELYFYMKFCKACMAQANKGFEMMKQGQWTTLVNEALANVQVIEESEDMSKGGVFKEYLEEFLTNRSRGRTLSDVRQGKPFEDEGRHIFKLAALTKHLKTAGARIGRTQVVARINELGGGKGDKMIDSRHVRIWYIPSDKIEAIKKDD